MGLVVVAYVGRNLLTNEAPRPSEWLTEAEQEELADLVASYEPGAWVAGCLLEEREHSDIFDVLGRQDGQRAFALTSRSGRATTVLVREGQAPSSSYDSVEGPGYFCYRPSK